MIRLFAATVVAGALIGGGLGFVTAPDDEPTVSVPPATAPPTPVTFPSTTTTTYLPNPTPYLPNPTPYLEEPPVDEWGGHPEYLDELLDELHRLLRQGQQHDVEADEAGPRGQEDPDQQAEDDPLLESPLPSELPLPRRQLDPVDVPLPVIQHDGHPSRRG